jgi:hypothetical protein
VLVFLFVREQASLGLADEEVAKALAEMMERFGPADHKTQVVGIRSSYHMILGCTYKLCPDIPGSMSSRALRARRPQDAGSSRLIQPWDTT